MMSNNKMQSAATIFGTAALTVAVYLAVRKFTAAEPKKTLYERLGGAPAIEAVVDKFYDKMLKDDRVSRFFKETNMTKQRQKQVSFLSYVCGAPTKYGGMAMDKAHQRLIKEQGMDDTHFDATRDNLDATLAEVGVPKDLRIQVENAFESFREQVMCRGQWAVKEQTLYEKLGGAPAIEAVVDKFYDKMLKDDRVSRFFKDTNMTKQRQKQVSFLSHVCGAPTKYGGMAMDKAHQRLIKEQGMDDAHFNATRDNLDTTLAEVGVPKELRQQVEDAFNSLREQVMCRGQWAIPA